MYRCIGTDLCWICLLPFPDAVQMCMCVYADYIRMYNNVYLHRQLPQAPLHMLSEAAQEDLESSKAVQEDCESSMPTRLLRREVCRCF